MDMEKMLAEFAAKGKTIIKIKTGIRRYEEKEMYKAIRGELKSDSESAFEREREWHRLNDTMAEARINGHQITGFDNSGNVYIGNGKKY